MEDNIYIIESPDKKWRAEISARLGANITRLQFDNNDVFVPLESECQLKKDPFIIGSPILFPANRTNKGEFEFQGIKYNLPINDSLKVANLHGFLYSVSFDVVEVCSNKIVLCYQNNGDIYPFDFEIKVEYLLDNKGIYQRYIILNTGGSDMPFTFALHTTFIEPESFSVPISFCQERDNNFIPTGRYIELNENEKLYATGYKSAGNVISGYYKAYGNRAIVGDFCYEVSNNFDHWILYNGGGNIGFLCIEPQCGAVNGLNLDNGFKTLSPSEKIEYYTNIYTIKDL